MPIKPSSTVWLAQVLAVAVFAELQLSFADLMTLF